jgi:5-methylthioadenosine/S-adenosylhomocysteine deaminase
MPDPYESVVAADPSWVHLVMVDGDLAYGRTDWLGDLVDRAERERVGAGGGVGLADAAGHQLPRSTLQPQPPPILAEPRAALITHCAVFTHSVR